MEKAVRVVIIIRSNYTKTVTSNHPHLDRCLQHPTYKLTEILKGEKSNKPRLMSRKKSGRGLTTKVHGASMSIL